MRLSDLADISKSEEIAASNDPSTLANALQGVLNGAQRFTHVMEVTEGPGPIWLYLQSSFRDASPLGDTGVPGTIVRKLLGDNASDSKGFRIRRTSIKGHQPAAIVEART